jgi:formylglycine-generating enzyme required for sulfatase activity
MVLVEGDYCTKLEHSCRHWLDDESLPFARCGEYAPETRCIGKRVSKRFCIDRFESADPGELPVNHQSYSLASQRCKSLNKRLCTESEWNFACEGEAMLPYPYGLRREPVCNQDRSDLFENNPKRRILKDLRRPNDITSRCVSPFGVYNMVGNLDEPTRRETGQQPRFNNALKGGWWMAGRNRCRPATTAHDDYYRDIQIGVRCCADPPAQEKPKPH